MIDFGLSKLVLTGGVALIVIGPEKLPKVARMAGSLMGRAQRYINNIKEEISREIDLEKLQNMEKDMRDATHEIEQKMEHALGQNNSALENESDSVLACDRAVQERLMNDRLAIKARDFHKKKINKSQRVPAWYKKRHGTQARIISSAGRTAKVRSGNGSSAFF